jgi:hypothetical protein
MPRPAIIAQYSVRVPGKPGVLARLTKLLAHQGIALRGMVAARSGAEATIHFLARRDTDLRGRLKDAGLLVQECEIIQFDMPNHHWELHKLARTLAEARINIISLYSAAAGDRLMMVLAADQPANAMECISKLGFNPEYSIC